MTEFGHTAIHGDGFILDSWGRGPFVITVGAKQYRFEDSDRFGPALIRKDGELLANPYPGERSPFWKAHRLWVRQGRRTESDGVTCIIDPPRPNIFRRIGRMRVIIKAGDEDGEYIEESPFGESDKEGGPSGVD